MITELKTQRKKSDSPLERLDSNGFVPLSEIIPGVMKQIVDGWQAEDRGVGAELLRATLSDKKKQEKNYRETKEPVQPSGRKPEGKACNE